MTTAGQQLLGSLSLAKHRDGAPIMLPRAKDETVMLAYDRGNSRLVELHVVTGTASPEPDPTVPTVRRWVKPESWLLKRKQSLPQRSNARIIAKTSGRRRLVQSPRVRARCLHRFYQPQSFSAPAPIAPQPVMGAEFHLKTCELLRQAARIQGPSFMSVLESGMDDDMPYYITHLNDGEFVQDYVRRRGAQPPVISLALVKQLLKDLSENEENAALLSTLRLERVLVTSQEEEYLQLRVFDYGLSHHGACTSLVRDICHLLFLLMTGQPYAGGNPENFGVIAELPSALRFLLRQVLTKPSETSITLKTLRTEVREALCSLVTLVQARNPRMLLAADEASLPISHLQHQLLGNIPLKTLFGASFRIETPELAGCHPFAIPAVNVCGAQTVTLHLLPPERIVSHSEFTPMPAQSWRQDPARQGHLLHMIQHWQGPDWAFLSEAREPGMSLGSLMARRGTLNPVEVTLLMRQILSGLEQALETGVHQVNLDPANIQLCVGYDGPVAPRDLERLHQKRLDVWPKFMVKLRLHKTMRCLCRPQLIDLGLGDFGSVQETDVLVAREERQRSLICLAAYLLSGVGQMRSITEFPVSVPSSAAGYLLECLQSVHGGSPLPSTADFTEKLCQHLTITYADTDEGDEPPVQIGEMESAGFVSDFEEDWPPVEATSVQQPEEPRQTPVAPHIKPFEFYQRPVRPVFHFPWVALSATILLLGVLSWMIFGNLPEDASKRIAATASAQTKLPSNEKPATEVAVPPAIEVPSAPKSLPVIHQIPVETPALTSTPPPAESALPASMPAMVAAAPAAENISSPEVVASTSPTPPPAVADAETVIVRRATVVPDNQLPSSTATAAKEAASTSIPEKPAPASPAQPAAVMAAIAPTLSTPAVIEPPPVSISPQPAVEAAAEPVTIRHAIILSPEEIRQAMQPQAKTTKKRRSSRR